MQLFDQDGLMVIVIYVICLVYFRNKKIFFNVTAKVGGKKFPGGPTKKD